MRSVLVVAVFGAACCAAPMFGTWKMNAARSTFTGAPIPRTFTLRIGPHPKGEVLTLERIERDGRIMTTSTILYLDAVPREVQDFDCTGTQLSRRIDWRTVEILRTCGTGAWTKLLRRTSVKQNELLLEISEWHVDGRRLVRRLVLQKIKEE